MSSAKSNIAYFPETSEIRTRRYRALEVQKRVGSCLNDGKPPTAIEIAKYYDRRGLIAAKLAKMFLECFRADTLHYRRFLFAEIKKMAVTLKYKLKFGHIRKMYQHFLESGGL